MLISDNINLNQVLYGLQGKLFLLHFTLFSFYRSPFEPAI